VLRMRKKLLEKTPSKRYIRKFLPRFAVFDGPRAQGVLRNGKRERVVANVVVGDEEALVADLLRAIAFVERTTSASTLAGPRQGS